MRMKLFGLSICVALTALGAASFASAVPKAARSTVTIKTLMTVTSATAVDADHNGKPSVGDYTIFRAVHRSPSTARVIGGGTGVYQGAYGELNGTWLDSKETKARAVFTITTA